MAGRRYVGRGRSARLRRPLQVGAIVLLGVLVALALLPLDPTTNDLSQRFSGPTPEHPLGTDQLGRDMLARLAVGARISVGFTVVALAVCAVTGTLLGVVAAWAGGVVGQLFQWIVDVLVAIPAVLIGLIVVAASGGAPGVWSLLVAVVVAGWTPFARLTYQLVVRERSREYVEGARRRSRTRAHRVPARAAEPDPAAAVAPVPAVREHPAHGGRTVVPRARAAAADPGVGGDARRREAVPVQRTAARRPPRAGRRGHGADRDRDRPGDRATDRHRTFRTVLKERRSCQTCARAHERQEARRGGDGSGRTAAGRGPARAEVPGGRDRGGAAHRLG
ncbi:Dipeptide transport system permease protein DppC [Pseudonocardia sp. Ae168_Ps1]|nr:Dipeptide transport system permease protein DppC [Pseudonocardia sp. Ae168_Ps1]OLL85008.1 Dipeptide transport system permease protein DppC [Pseudonocardia sp. Ae263_Ps1]